MAPFRHFIIFVLQRMTKGKDKGYGGWGKGSLSLGNEGGGNFGIYGKILIKAEKGKISTTESKMVSKYYGPRLAFCISEKHTVWQCQVGKMPKLPFWCPFESVNRCLWLEKSSVLFCLAA